VLLSERRNGPEVDNDNPTDARCSVPVTPTRKGCPNPPPIPGFAGDWAAVFAVLAVGGIDCGVAVEDVGRSEEEGAVAVPVLSREQARRVYDRIA